MVRDRFGPEDPDGLETVQVMDFDPEEVQRMDVKAEEEEISRLKAMPALIELQPHQENDYNDSFAPTSLMAIPRRPLHLAACCPKHYGVQVINVKDAFLMVPQPEDERASVTYRGKRYKLVRCLPGAEDGSEQVVHPLQGCCA